MRPQKVMKMSGLPFFRVHLLFIHIVMNGVMISSSQTYCTTDASNAVQACMDKMKLVMDKPELAFPENEEQIRRSCRYMKEAMDCLKDFADRCYEQEQKELFLSLFAGFQSIIHDLCTSGSPLREAALKHRNCYKSVEAEHRECIDKYSENQNTLTNETQGTLEEEQIKEMCCGVNGMRDCLMTPLVEKCDKEAADLARQTLEKLLTPSFGRICMDVKESECSAGSSVITPGFILLILLLIAVLKH